MSVRCQKHEQPFFQCCCECIHLRPTFEHCTTNPKLRKEKNDCICGIQNGWACCRHLERIHINWSEHSVGCEEHTKATETIENRKANE